MQSFLKPAQLATVLLFGLPLFATQAQIPQTPRAFERNLGQAARQVKYQARAPHFMVWLTEQGAMIGMRGTHGSTYVEIQCVGGNPAPRIDAEDQRAGISNYFIGRNPKAWHTDVPQYGRVRYRAVYPGIDLVFYGGPSNLEYDFDLAPGTDPSRISLAFVGARKVSLDADGGLIVDTGDAQLRNLPPRITQNGKRVGGHWTLQGNRAGFVTDRFDRSKPLVIDPILTYATYAGGASGSDAVGALAIDKQGNILVGGETNSVDFPLTNPLDPTLADRSGANVYAFILKINPSAAGPASLVYSTFFATAGVMDEGSVLFGLTSDQAGNAYFTGSAGDNLPIVSALPGQSTYNAAPNCPVQGVYTPCDHVYVAEISPTGNKLLFSTYLGGSNEDQGFGIQVDSAGNIYVAGQTASGDFPVAGNSVQSLLRGNGNNGFVSVISASHTLAYSTFFGSFGTQDSINAIAVDSNGRIFIAGQAGAAGLPIANGFQPSYPGGANQPVAGFVSILNPSLPQPLVYSTYLGGTDHMTSASAVATDGSGNIYVAGATQATNFPVTPTAIRGPGQGANPKVFVTKLNPTAQGNAQLTYSTILGGSFADGAAAMAVSASGIISVAGSTNSFNFQITNNAYQPIFVGSGPLSSPTPMGFLAQIDPTKSGAAGLLYSSYAGSVNSSMYALALDSTGKIVAIGGSGFAGAPLTAAAFQSKYAGGDGDGYVASFDMSQTGPMVTNVENAASLSADPNGTISPGMVVTLKGAGLGPATATNGTIDPSSGKVSTNVDGVQVLIDNTPCPLLYISSTQINAVAPYELANKVGQSVIVEVTYNQAAGSALAAIVSATNPGIFSFDDGSGQGAILNQDGTVNGASNAAARGSLIQIFATGEGQTVPPGVDGAIANEPLGSIPTPAASVSVSIGGVQVPSSAVTYAGTLPGGVAGALQINAMIPANAPTGAAIPIVLTIGQNSSPKTLTIAVQ